MFEGIQAFDAQAVLWIAEHLRSEWLDRLMVAYTSLGNGDWVFIAISVILLLFCATRRAGASALIAMLLGLLVTNLTLKPMVARARPWVVMEHLTTLVTSSDMNSFPSGHTCAAFSFAVALAVLLPQKWAKAAALIAAALMGFSRLYVGAHFPTDVLAGAVVGVLCGLAGVWLSGKIMVRFTGRKAAG